jgi:hypothetical protein
MAKNLAAYCLCLRFCAPEADYRVLGSHACPMGFQSCFSLMSHYFLIPSF